MNYGAKGSKAILRFLKRFNLLFSKVADLLVVERFPAIHLDQTNALKHLRCQPDSFICDFYTLRALFDYN
jgi:hypothetical protein